MNVLRKFAGILAAAALALTAPVQQAAAADLKNDPFVTRNADRKNFEPGGQYHLFGTPRGSVTERTGSIGIRQAYTHQAGNLLIQQADINGTIGYKTRFSGHGHEVHAPFDNHAARSASDEKGSVSQGFTVYCLEWSGHEHHPADGYDGPQGGGYPAPKGARDEYSYKVEGTARSIRLNPQDTRSIGQRFRDNHNNLRGNFSERAREANKKMFEHNPKLSRWGNAMEFINGVAAGALNPFQSTAEALGIDGILDGAGKSAKTDGGGKAAVSDNFADAAYARKVAEESAALNRIGQNQRNAVDLSGKLAKSVLNVRQNKRIDSLISQAEPGHATKGRTTQYEKQGNYSNAVEDFHSIRPEKVKNREGNTKTGKLADGRDIIVRSKSDDGRPTLEIQNGKKKTKIRYGEK